MGKVNTLLMKARDALQGYTERLIMAFVYPDDNGLWVADGRLWDGVKGGGTKSAIRRGYSSIDVAIAAVDEMKQEYHVDEKFKLFVDSIGADG